MTISDWERYVLRRWGSEGWQVNYNKILEGRKNCESYVSTKIQETNIMIQIKLFFDDFFICFLLCSLFFIRTFDYHQNNKVAEDTYQ